MLWQRRRGRAAVSYTHLEPEAVLKSIALFHEDKKATNQKEHDCVTPVELENVSCSGNEISVELVPLSFQMVQILSLIHISERLKKGIDSGCGNAILIKLNQIGSVSETLEAIKMAHKAGYTAISLSLIHI